MSSTFAHSAIKNRKSAALLLLVFSLHLISEWAVMVHQVEHHRTNKEALSVSERCAHAHHTIAGQKDSDQSGYIEPKTAEHCFVCDSEWQSQPVTVTENLNFKYCPFPSTDLISAEFVNPTIPLISFEGRAPPQIG